MLRLPPSPKLLWTGPGQESHALSFAKASAGVKTRRRSLRRQGPGNRAEDDNDLVVRLYESAGAATKTRLTTYWPIAAARVVNFVEDPLRQGPSMRSRDGGVTLDLRPWEIRMIKLRLRDVRGVKMTGTRGPGPVRQF